MDIIRTPESRFQNLSGYSFDAKYVNIDGRRIHYIDQGDPSSRETILCLHGEPTWVYLYRKCIPILSRKARVLAMDFVGFGRSDKLIDQEGYSFDLHLQTLKNFIRFLDIKEITLVTHDWGGLIGLTAATQMRERFSRLVIMNTFLPTGDEPLPIAFLRWRSFTARVGKKIPIGRSVKGGVAQSEKITDEVLAAYEAPFPNEKYKAGAAAWPLLVPLEPKDPGASEMRMARRILSNWQKPVLIMFSDADPITKGGKKFFEDLIPSARAYPLITISNAGHFLQEDKGEELAHHIIDFVEATPLS